MTSTRMEAQLQEKDVTSVAGGDADLEFDLEFLKEMPKVELHVHLEGSIRPETLVKLAKRHHFRLPISDAVEDGEDEEAEVVKKVAKWYQFKDFQHFIDIYMTVCDLLREPSDIELITREFLETQSRQNVLYSEVTFTAFTHYHFRNISFEDQLAAINRARVWALENLSPAPRMGLIIDIPRMIEPDQGLLVAQWIKETYTKQRSKSVSKSQSGEHQSHQLEMGDLVVAIGLGGPEEGHPPSKFASAFQLIREAGIPMVLHAGEVVGPESIKDALNQGTCRLGHGIRCLEDEELVQTLVNNHIPLEVCLTSNLKLGVFGMKTMSDHPLLLLLKKGLTITINSDDPPMFNTHLVNEYQLLRTVFGLNLKTIQSFVHNAVKVSLLPSQEKEKLHHQLQTQFEQLHQRLSQKSQQHFLSSSSPLTTTSTRA